MFFCFGFGIFLFFSFFLGVGEVIGFGDEDARRWICLMAREDEVSEDDGLGEDGDLMEMLLLLLMMMILKFSFLCFFF